jgi:hypothetical protein
LGIVAVVIGSALLISGEPKVQRLIAEPAAGCDVAIAFHFSSHWKRIDNNAYRRVAEWLQKNTTKVSNVEEIPWRDNGDAPGSLTLCVTSTSPTEVDGIFKDIRRLLPTNSRQGSVVLQSRTGRRFESSTRDYLPD